MSQGQVMPIDRTNAERRIQSLVRGAESIRPAALAKEAQLMALKWYDYRFMSPLDATMLFGRLYQEQFRRTIAREVDRNLAKNAQGIDLTRVRSDPRQFTALWTARQHADELGIRYQEYLEFCFEFATNVRRKALPQPNQLYFSRNSEVAWLLQIEPFWSDRVLSGLAKVEDLPQYRFELYRALPAQAGYRQFILNRAIEGNKRWTDVMRVHAVEKRQIPIRNFVSAIGSERFIDELRSVKIHRRSFPFASAASVNITAEQLWQSCFGVPHAYSEVAEPCSECPQSAGCQRLAQVVLERVVRRCGTADPVTERERQKTRNRVRKHRAKKKSAGIVSRTRGGEAADRPEAGFV